MLFTVDTGKAYQIKDIIPGRFYYPRDPGKAYNACNCGVANSAINPRWTTGRDLGLTATPQRGRDRRMDTLRRGESQYPSVTGIIIITLPINRPQRRVLISHSTTYTRARLTFWWVLACLPFLCTPVLPLKTPIYPPSIQLSGPNLGRNTSCESIL